MSILRVLLLEVDPGREQEFVELVRLRNEQSARLGASRHRVYRLDGDDPAMVMYLGTMEFDSREHFERFNEAQAADHASQETIERVRGPGGMATVRSESIGLSIG